MAAVLVRPVVMATILVASILRAPIEILGRGPVEVVLETSNMVTIRTEAKQMIYIVDNGANYSAHALFFFELPDSVPLPEGERIILQCPRAMADLDSRRRWTIVATATELSWREENGTCSLLDPISIQMLAQRSLRREEDPDRYACLKAWLASCPKEVLIIIRDQIRDAIANMPHIFAESILATIVEYIETGELP